jgi:DNA invertase Pin-like site-specific DNA recombinase
MIYAYMRVSTPQQTLENQHYALLKLVCGSASMAHREVDHGDRERGQARHRACPRPAPGPVDRP